jgi:hypothetical protein
MPLAVRSTIADKVIPALDHHIPGKQWVARWARDEDGYFPENSTLLAFRWSDR